MSLRSAAAAAATHSMRGYYIAIAGGALLIVSAFLPWVYVGDVAIGGPRMAILWVLALGGLAMLLGSLSIATRRNSRHPLLLVGLVALGVHLFGQRVMMRAAEDSAWVDAQRTTIVYGLDARPPAETATGAGIYLGAAASVLIVLFGLTIVVRRASRPYLPPVDDDV
jgi:uncharacterized membrane protein YiaA